MKHSSRIKRKRTAKVKRARVRSVIAKDLLTSGKFGQLIIKDKRGNKHDLRRMTHYDLIQAIQELNND